MNENQIYKCAETLIDNLPEEELKRLHNYLQNLTAEQLAQEIEPWQSEILGTTDVGDFEQLLEELRDYQITSYDALGDPFVGSTLYGPAAIDDDQETVPRTLALVYGDSTDDHPAIRIDTE